MAGSDENQAKASKARERGNTLYKQGNLREAEIEYNVAQSLTPEDPAPISNLSAVKFEMGQYEEAAALAVKALSLSKDSAPDRKDRLLSRLSKSYLHANNAHEALSAAERMTEGKDREVLLADVRLMLDSEPQQLNKVTLRKNIVGTLPRYRPSLQEVQEYYPVGHDEAEPLLKGKFLKDFVASSGDRDLAFLYCGIGDARNMYATMLAAATTTQKEVLEQLPATKARVRSLHLTALDLKAPALAKILIMFDLVDQYNLARHDETQGTEKSIAQAMAYIYIGNFYPPVVHDMIQTSLARLIGLLERGERALPWVFIPEQSRASIIRYLKQWKGPAVNAHDQKTARRIFESIRNEENMMKQRMRFGNMPDRVPRGCEDDKIFIDKLAILEPPKDFVSGDEPELRKLLDSVKSGAPSAVTSLDEYLSKHWKMNVTLLDMEWMSMFGDPKAPPTAREEEIFSCLAIDAIQEVEHVTDKLAGLSMLSHKRASVIERFCYFFCQLADAIQELSPVMTVELISGEVADVMEKLNYHCYDDRLQTFPTKFDRIHLSNIPDYVGGPMNPMIFARPLLKDAELSDVQFNILLNCGSFPSNNQLLAEYTLMPSEQRIADHFHLKCPRRSMFPFGGGGNDYMKWQWQPAVKMPWDKLMTRPQLETWLYGWFLKLCLPYPRPTENPMARVHSPFNLSIFLRLIEKVHEVGYPAHWLAGILSSLCAGRITTTVRAPKAVVLSSTDIHKVYPSRQISIAPWAIELTTLVSLWRPLLGFGFAAPKNALISPNEVREYSLRIDRFIPGEDMAPLRFMIVFWDMKFGKPPVNLYKLLLDEEGGDASVAAANKRNKAIHVVSAWAYDFEIKAARFWLRKDAVNSMLERAEDWMAYVWRTDSWTRQTQGVPIEGLVKGRSFIS